MFPCVLVLVHLYNWTAEKVLSVLRARKDGKTLREREAALVGVGGIRKESISECKRESEKVREPAFLSVGKRIIVLLLCC